MLNIYHRAGRDTKLFQFHPDISLNLFILSLHFISGHPLSKHEATVIHVNHKTNNLPYALCARLERLYIYADDARFEGDPNCCGHHSPPIGVKSRQKDR